MSLLVKCLVFHHSKIILFHFLFWSCALYILYGYIAFLIYDWQIFSHSLWLILKSFKLSSEEQIKQKKLMKLNLPLFFFYGLYFWYYIYVCLTKDLKDSLLCFLLEVL